MLSFYLDPGEINVTLNPTYLKICPKFPLCYTFLSSCLCHQLEPDIISRKYHHLILKVNTYSVAIGCSPIITPISTSSLNKCGANHKFFFFPLTPEKDMTNGTLRVKITERNHCLIAAVTALSKNNKCPWSETLLFEWLLY